MEEMEKIPRGDSSCSAAICSVCVAGIYFKRHSVVGVLYDRFPCGWIMILEARNIEAQNLPESNSL